MRRQSTVRKVTVFYSPDAKKILEGKLPEHVPGIVQFHAFIAALSMRCACNQPFLHGNHPMLLLVSPHPRKYLVPGSSESGHLDHATRQATRVEIHITMGSVEGQLMAEVEFFRIAREQVYSMRINVDPTGDMRVSLSTLPHPV